MVIIIEPIGPEPILPAKSDGVHFRKQDKGRRNEGRSEGRRERRRGKQEEGRLGDKEEGEIVLNSAVNVDHR